MTINKTFSVRPSLVSSQRLLLDAFLPSRSINVPTDDALQRLISILQINPMCYDVFLYRDRSFVNLDLRQENILASIEEELEVAGKRPNSPQMTWA